MKYHNRHGPSDGVVLSTRRNGRMYVITPDCDGFTVDVTCFNSDSHFSQDGFDTLVEAKRYIEDKINSVA